MAVILAFLLLLLLPFSTEAATPTGWVNIKSPIFGATGNGSTDDTAAIQAAIDYAFAHGLTSVYCPAGTYKTSSTIYLDPPGNLRSNLSSPANFAFSMSFFGDPAASGNYQGCRISANFNNGIAFLVGTGQGMRVSDIAVVGPASGYRGNQNVNGVGIGLSGGSAGSSANLIENTYVANFYTLYKTDANDGCCLSDSNSFHKVGGENGYYGILFAGTQSDINDVIAPRIAYTTIIIDSEVSRQVNVFGGNLSGVYGQNASFPISSISSFTKTVHDNGFNYTFTATVASPDAYIPNVYNSYTIATAHFGIIPLTMTGWNGGTYVGTFQIRPPWVFANYGVNDLTTVTDMQAEVAAVTTLYAAERVVVAQGSGIALDGIHVEDPSACSSLLISTATSGGASTNEVKNPFFNYDPSQPGAALPILYCQRTFPFLGKESGSSKIILTGGDYGIDSTGVPGFPILLDIQSLDHVTGSSLGDVRFNINVYDSGGYAYSQLGGYGQFNSEARGAGTWDNNFFRPSAWSGGAFTNFFSGELTSPYCGYEPCPWVTPNLTPATYASVSGSLGAIGSYPPIACRTVFKSVDWNSGTLAHAFLRSASCPGYSWGQNLTDATVGETVTWSYKGGSDVLYLNAKTLGWMFPGLGFSLDNGGGAVTYTVTGVYQDLGYVTVMNATSNGGAPLAGTKTMVYSCPSSCTIGQAAYSWSAY